MKPDAVIEATKEYVEDNNALGRFIADCLVQSAGDKIGSNDLYHAYVLWCLENKEEPQAQKHFPKSMAERGIRSKRGNAGSFFIGYRLKSEERANASKPIEGRFVFKPAPYVEMDDYLRMTDEQRDKYHEQAQDYLNKH